MRPAAAFPVAAALLMAGCGGEEPRNMSDEEVAAELGGLRIEPGLWEVTSEVLDVSAPNLPVEVRNRMVGPRGSMRHCISPEQAERPSANFLAARESSDCEYRGFRMREGRLTGAMTCPNASATMDGRYGPTSYEMRMEMRSPMPDGATMILRLRSSGRRIGECEGQQQ
jgi:hypothetical protein